jgi:dihydroorotase
LTKWRAKQPLVVDLPEIVVIRGARAIDSRHGLDALVDVVLERGRITRVGPNVGAEAAVSERAKVLDGTERWLLPAFVDLHSHFRDPGQEYKEDITSGLAAAGAGGFAHVCAMPNTKPVNDTRAVTEMMLYRAGRVPGPQLHPVGAITVGLQGQQLAEMADLREAGAVAVSDDGACVASSGLMRRAMEYARNFGLPLMQHAEDPELVHDGDMHEGAVSSLLGLRGRPRVAEDVIVARDLILAEFVGAHYHLLHVSTRGAIRLIREAKSRGIKTTCEATPHHLLLTDAACLGYDTFCKVNPPLREAEDVQALREALADGTIDAIATDHAPHSPIEKDCEFAIASPGMIGLQQCFGLLLDLVEQGHCSLPRLLDALSTAPANIIGITPPSIKENTIADLVLVDPNARYTSDSTPQYSKSRNTPFMNRELKGRILTTIAQGRIVYQYGGEA